MMTNVTGISKYGKRSLLPQAVDPSPRVAVAGVLPNRGDAKSNVFCPYIGDGMLPSLTLQRDGLDVMWVDNRTTLACGRMAAD